MESPSAWASLGDGGKNGSQSSRSATTIEDMFSARDKSGLIRRRETHTIRGGRVVRGVLRSREFEDGKVAESSTIQARCGLPKADQIPRGLGPAGRRRQDSGAPGWPVPATEAQDSSGPHGQAGRCLTSRAMLAVGINGSRLRYFLDLGESFRR